jgi:hypothetical protein
MFGILVLLCVDCTSIFTGLKPGANQDEASPRLGTRGAVDDFVFSLEELRRFGLGFMKPDN